MEYNDDNREIICIMGQKGPQGPIVQTGSNTEYRIISANHAYSNNSGSSQYLLITAYNGDGYDGVFDIVNLVGTTLKTYSQTGLWTDMTYKIDNGQTIKLNFNNGTTTNSHGFSVVIIQL